MKLEFLDGTQLEVINIFGGPRLVMGVMRDTLRIEVSPNTIDFKDLKTLFKDNPATALLYCYTETVDESGNNITEKNEIGEGYSIFVSVSDEERKVAAPPGRLAPDEIEEVFVVTIAQMTYQEYHQTQTSKPEAVNPSNSGE